MGEGKLDSRFAFITQGSVGAQAEKGHIDVVVQFDGGRCIVYHGAPFENNLFVNVFYPAQHLPPKWQNWMVY